MGSGVESMRLAANPDSRRKSCWCQIDCSLTQDVLLAGEADGGDKG